MPLSYSFTGIRDSPEGGRGRYEEEEEEETRSDADGEGVACNMIHSSADGNGNSISVFHIISPDGGISRVWWGPIGG